MKRDEFLERLVRIILFGALAGILVITGKRAITGSSCSSCPGKGICSGKSDCSIFLSEKR